MLAQLHTSRRGTSANSFNVMIKLIKIYILISADNFPKCKRDANFDKCLVDAVNQAIQLLKSG